MRDASGPVTGPSGNNPMIETDNISNRNLEISTRFYDKENEQIVNLFYPGLSCEFMKFDNLVVHKVGLIDKFDACDLYADAEGRVDDTGGTYTGETPIILSGQSNADFTQANDDRRQTAVQSRRIISAKRRKTKIRKLTKKGGY